MARLLVLALALFAIGHADASPLRTGLASWYGTRHEGRIMANGQPYRAHRLTAASPVLPLGAWVRVRRHRGRAVLVQITDRGPYIRGRIIDLSQAAAAHLGMLEKGVALVSVERVR